MEIGTIMFELSPSKAAALRVLSTAASTPQDKPNTAVAVAVAGKVCLAYSLVTCLVVASMDGASLQQ